jgi:hypothetical protein
VIRKKAFEEIKDIVAAAETRDFRPLLYVIPFRGLTPKVKQVPVNQRAHPLSIEFVIEALPSASFDAIIIEWT